MYKKIILSSLAALLLVGAGIHTKAQSDSSSDTGSAISDTSSEVQDVTNASITNSDTSATGSAISSVDASGNMTIKPNEDYTSAIDLASGNLTLSVDSTVTKNVRVRNGNLTLNGNSAIEGNVIVDNGNLIMAANTTIKGNVSVSGMLMAKDNIDIGGATVSVGPSGVITIGSNSDIIGTVTSAAGMKVGSNTDVKLFLSGKTVEIDGKTYKLGGTVLAAGANSSVGMPYIPKPKTGAAAPAAQQAGTSQPAETAAAPDQNMETAAAPMAASEETSATVTTDMSLPDATNIQSLDDVDKYVSAVLNKDSNIGNIDLSSDAVNLDYKTPASLFGFIPMSIPAHITVSKDKSIGVSYPWYSFLMSTNKKAVEDAVSANVSSVLGTSTDATAGEGFSAKIQATISNSILAAFRNIF